MSKFKRLLAIILKFCTRNSYKLHISLDNPHINSRLIQYYGIKEVREHEFYQTIILSLQSRKGKSLILLAIFLVVINLVFAGFTIQSASSKATDLARQQLGADINLRIDINKYLEEQNNNQNANEAIKVPSIEKRS